ncbi:MAG: FAS1-like dehydratase domain-containing protein [Dermatophilaceae bacterium]
MTESIERTEVLVPGPARALAGLLGVRLPDVAGADGLPLLWHWIYLLERPDQADLGPDGHPARGGIPVPPGPGRRRMWAAGRVVTSGRLRCDEPATRHTRVLNSTDKQGRTGPMTFVKIGHEIMQRGRVVISEEQDIVYRAAAPADGAPAPAGDSDAESVDPAPTAPGDWEVDVSPTLLFRYSALTYNAHRIHYDRDFCRDVEGYPGLLVHGPLQATLMAEAARRHGVDTTSAVQFDYRLLSPLLDHQGLVVSATPADDGWATAVRDRSGRQTATGTLRGAPGPSALQNH